MPLQISRAARRRWLVLLVVALPAVVAAALPRGGGIAAQEELPAPGAALPGGSADPARVEGHEKCIDCHVTEVKSWLASKHATRAFDLLRTANTSLEYARALDIRPQDLARNSVCIKCHATQRQQAGHADVIPGVSCEACHNGSGGADGWLNRHAVYGPPGTQRAEETAAHFRRRADACRRAGQLRSSDVYLLARRCFQCHVVNDEKLAAAGHDHGENFELVEKMLGEVRHNFFLDRGANAAAPTLWTHPLHGDKGRTAAGRHRVLFVVGQMVDLETSLRSLAAASEDDDFSDLMIDRIEDAFGLLAEDILEEVEETPLPEIEQIVEAVGPVWETLDDDGFAVDQRPRYVAAADAVAAAARQFARRDGSRLAELDDLELVPAGPFPGVYQP